MKQQKLRDASLQCFDFIENENLSGLMSYLTETCPEIKVNEINDQNGKTLLHECTFQDTYQILKSLLEYGKSQGLKPD